MYVLFWSTSSFACISCLYGLLSFYARALQIKWDIETCLYVLYEIYQAAKAEINDAESSSFYTVKIAELLEQIQQVADYNPKQYDTVSITLI